MATKQTHLQAILSAVDRLSPTLSKIGLTTTRTRGVLMALNTVNLGKLGGNVRMIHKSVADIGSATQNLAGKLLPLVGLGALSTAGLAAGFFAGARGAMQFSAGLNDASEITGETVTDLQLLQGAFRLGGVEAEAATDAIVKFNKGMAEGAAGKDKGFAGLMTRLRIPMRDAKGQIRSLTDVLPELSDAFAKNTNPAVRTRIAMELFGKSGSKLIGTLAQGGKSLKDLFAELESSGRVLSSGAVGRLDKLDENLEELGVRYKVLSGEILSRAAPAMQRLVERMQGWISANREVIAQRLGAVIERMANAFTGWIESGGFERLTTELRRAWTVLSEFVDRLGGLGGVLKLVGALILAGPVASLFALGGAFARLGIVLLPLVVQGFGLLLGPIGAVFAALRAGQVVLLGMSLTFGQLALLAAPFVLAAAAIAGAAYLIYRNWDVVGPFLAGVWEGIKSAAMVAWNFLRFAFSWSPLGVIVNNWGAITEWAGAFWQNLSAVAGAGIELLGGLLRAWSPLQLVRDAWEPVVTFLSGVWDRVKGIIGPVLSVLGGGAQRLGSAVQSNFGEQASNREYGPRLAGPTPLMQAGAMQTSAQVQGELKVRFDNAPPGMRVEPGQTNSAGLSFNPDVGYRSMGGIG